MDIMMPDMDGVETYSELQKNIDFKAPVVALTADAVSGAEQKYLDLGFYAYIPKPINIDILKQILNEIENK